MLESAQKIYNNHDAVEDKQNKSLTKAVVAALRERDDMKPRGGGRKQQERKGLEKDHHVYCKEKGHWKKSVTTKGKRRRNGLPYPPTRGGLMGSKFHLIQPPRAHANS